MFFSTALSMIPIGTHHINKTRKAKWRNLMKEKSFLRGNEAFQQTEQRRTELLAVEDKTLPSRFKVGALTISSLRGKEAPACVLSPLQGASKIAKINKVQTSEQPLNLTWQLHVSHFSLEMSLIHLANLPVKCVVERTYNVPQRRFPMTD